MSIRKTCELSLITHACAIIKDEESALIFDPWFSGTAFNNGWSLKQEIDPSTLNLNSITHVYISHEHPDHFHIPTLKKLNNNWDPIFLIQKSYDRRMAKFIKHILKKRVLELRNGESYKISNAISLKIYSHGHMDSFALIKAGNNTILNINDCVLKSKKSLVSLKNRLFPENIDVLMSQYSFASFQGNEENKNLLIRAGNQHLDWIKQRNDFFKPKVFIPFASGINWCAKENNYLNKYSVNFKRVVEAIQDCSNKPLILDKNKEETTIELESIKITSYKKESYSENIQNETFETNKISRTEIINQIYEAFDSAKNKLNKQNLGVITNLMFMLGKLRILKTVLLELNFGNHSKYYFELLPGFQLKYLADGKEKLSKTKQSQISMAYDSFKYCLNNQFGAETLWVNSRFKIINGKPKDFFKHFYPSILSNQGFTFPLGYIKFFLERILIPKIQEFEILNLTKIKIFQKDL